MTLPWPPSVNGYWRTFRNRQILSAKAREYRAEVLKHREDPYCSWPVLCLDERVRVHLLLCPPDRRDRDIDNYTKGVFDALTHACVWVDDKQVKSLGVDWGECTGKPGSVLVTIEEL